MKSIIYLWNQFIEKLYDINLYRTMFLYFFSENRNDFPKQHSIRDSVKIVDYISIVNGRCMYVREQFYIICY